MRFEILIKLCLILEEERYLPHDAKSDHVPPCLDFFQYHHHQGLLLQYHTLYWYHPITVSVRGLVWYTIACRALVRYETAYCMVWYVPYGWYGAVC